MIALRLFALFLLISISVICVGTGGPASSHRNETVACRFGIPRLDRPGFRIDRELGGGAFLDVGSYPIYAVTSLFPDSEPEVRFADIVVADGSPVDTAGQAILRYDGRVSVTLEWRINTAYRNEIDMWGSEGSVSSARVFSKPADYVPIFRFLDVHGNAHDESGTAANHFVAMFTAFRGLVDDPNRAEAERAQIARRAWLADCIRDRSRQSQADY